MSTKQCLKCNEVKALAMFGRLAARKDGFHYYCKLCIKDINAERYVRNRQGSIECAVIWAQNNRKRKRQLNRESAQRHPETQERGRYKRRARLAKVEYDPTVRLNNLYRRDNARCQLCSEHVERDEASIDHIVPVVSGGSHTWDNVQLAHLKCNCVKGTRPLHVEPLTGIPSTP